MKKTKWILPFLALGVTLSSPCHAQWAIIYGGEGYDGAYSIQQTSDGGHIVAGRTDSFGAGDADFWVLKLNAYGGVDWQKRYGGSSFEEAWSIRHTSDGGYVVAGQTESFGAGSGDVWVLKLSCDGSVAWQKTYGGSGFDKGRSIQPTADGSYILVGETDVFGATGGDFWVLKLNANGSVAWQKRYGGSGWDTAYAVQQTTEGGYVVAGGTDSFGAGDADFWVLKLNSDGSIAWQRTYGGDNDDSARSIQGTLDGGYILAGYTDSFGAGQRDFWVLKLHSDGTVAWEKRYGGTESDDAHSIQQTSDGGYIVAGVTASFGAGYGDLWVLKLDSDGTVDWEKTYGGMRWDGAYSVQQTAEGRYIVAGLGSDMCVLKLDGNGEIPDCSVMGASSATVSDTSATVVDTEVVPEGSSVVPVDTDADPQDTLAEPSVVCSAAHLAVLREKLFGKQGLFVYYTLPGLDGETEPPMATDRNFGNSTLGSNIIAMACVDTDGNGVDEIAVIRQRPGGRQRLEIYNPPQTVGGDTGDPIASDLSFGDLNSDKKNIALGGVDTDGDGIDEIAVVRQMQTGKQRLFIFNAPQGIEGETEPAIATDSSFGHSNTGKNIIAMTGVDVNGDGVDEIAVVMQRAGGGQRLEIYDAPQSVGGETGDAIASDLTFGDSTTNKRNIALTRMDINHDGIDKIAVVREKVNGRQRLEIYNPPQTVDGETGDPIASDLSFGAAGTDKRSVFISGMKF
jgi:uncharacterized delta-60 repeat protein